jgi:hypothetical protein
LQAAAPQLTVLFTRLGPFARASRPAFRSLGDLSVTGIRAFRKSRGEIAQLRRLAADAPATGKPLRQFLQTLDDRSRAFDSDPRAAVTAPPSPDPTSMAAAPGKGFTGMEGFWNFFYWQTLSINQFDGISHFLRVLGFNDNDCSPYQADARPPSMGGTADTDRIRRRCNSYLGPYQPGVTAPDPTQGRVNPKITRTTAKKIGERRGAGQPEAGPLPGQTDWSVPHPTLPPSVQNLLDSLGGGASPAAPSVPGLPDAPRVDPTQALDYLLGP